MYMENSIIFDALIYVMVQLNGMPQQKIFFLKLYINRTDKIY